ncbi:glycosyltransferase family 95 protein [Pseudoscourfieldia marina]
MAALIPRSFPLLFATFLASLFCVFNITSFFLSSSVRNSGVVLSRARLVLKSSSSAASLPSSSSPPPPPSPPLPFLSPPPPPVKDDPLDFTSASARAKRRYGENIKPRVTGRKFHTVITANNAKYVEWQTRIAYHYWKEMKAKFPDSDVGGFTRILHGGHKDNLMDDIPTYVAKPLPGGNMGYVVLDRPYAFVQWLRDVDIEEDYIFMTEPDHILVRPLENLAPSEDVGAAFPFFYINVKQFESTVQRFNDKGVPLEDMAPIGNSPVILHKSKLKEIAPLWSDLAVRLKQDGQAVKDFGWVLEMYAFSIASAQVGIKYELRLDFMVQPPWDTQFLRKCVGPSEQGYRENCQDEHVWILHYTYGNDYTLEGEFTPGKYGAWRFDKRSYMATYPAFPLEMPPKQLALPGPKQNVIVWTLIEKLNEAAKALNI